MSREHALDAGLLPGPYRDPFAGLLVAQSRRERLRLVMRDPVFRKARLRVIW